MVILQSSLHFLTLRARAEDPRQKSLVQNVRALGILSVRAIKVSDLLFLRNVVADQFSIIESIVADPLLQTVDWNKAPHAEIVVETSLIAGVTDPVANEFLRIARKMGVGVTDALSGRRYEIEGSPTTAEIDLIVRKLLANPVIEHWAINEPVKPTFASDSAASVSTVGEYLLTHETTDAELQALGKERALALDIEELRVVRDHYANEGRPARDVELEMIAQTWSEHCSHKTFRARITTDDGSVVEPLIAQLRRTTDEIDAPFVVSSFVGNAGIVSYEDNITFAVKAETHNHPSAIEPFGGANTGVGGVIRDVIGASHQPIACTNILCFGPSDFPVSELPEGVFHPQQIRAGVVAGIADYGNKIGLPTIAGAVLYDNGYIANPLVYAGCIGIAHEPYVVEQPQPGDRVVVLGGRTGRDGLRGATFSSMTMDATTGDVAGASVQIGDPIVEKLLIDVLGRSRHLYRSITDCGAGGLSSAIGEMAEGVGARVELSGLPLKYPGLAPWEIWLSEAQERMVVAVADTAPLFEACQRYGVECIDIGEFTGDERLVVTYEGTTVVDIDTNFLHDGRPQRCLNAVMPKPDRTPMSAEAFGSVFGTLDIAATTMRLLAHPNIASKESIIRRYDHEIGGATLVRPIIGANNDGHADGVVLAEPLSSSGIAVGIGVNPWMGIIDAERMALAVVDEAMRNVVAVGADPRTVALLDNFSWGDPQRPTTLGELVAAVDGCCQAARAFSAPFVSGKDSLNNEYFGSDNQRHAVPPTLVITAMAHVPVADAVVTPDLKQSGNVLILLGRTLCELGGSHLAMLNAVAGGVVPSFDTAAPQRYQRLHEAILNGDIESCHDVSEGGITVAIAEMAMAGRLGVEITIALPLIRGWWYFSESCGRFILEVKHESVAAIRERFGADAQIIGRVVDEQVLSMGNGQSLTVAEMLTCWKGAS